MVSRSAIIIPSLKQSCAFPLLLITTVLLTLSFYFKKTETVSLAEGSKQQWSWNSQAPTLSVCVPRSHFWGKLPARIINTYKNSEAGGEGRRWALTLTMTSLMGRKENEKDVLEPVCTACCSCQIVALAAKIFSSQLSMGISIQYYCLQ